MGGIQEEERGQTAIIEKHDKTRFSKFYNKSPRAKCNTASCIHMPLCTREERKKNKLTQAAHAETDGKSYILQLLWKW